MTWDHPRGFDPLVACARLWRERTGVDVLWERRSLQDFESFPVQTLAQQYDLIVIDHPHVGQITLACALGYRDFRFGGTWRGQHPRLVAWLESFAARVPAFAATAPKA